ncbi:hypothetical protein BLNAU_18971 [Blattamonas nauphoetae]|uniref:Uncharacterized protein n=1 Tax=Blattamonas nauphoetae TaxID=2049346 RepID=A0ABQ9X2Y2_9EUKA|nr:hypothetical protein BLNAU_18971 [Blattamonas nauphoetae]
MDVKNILSHPQAGSMQTKHEICLEVFLSQICGDCERLRPTMLNTLLALATESDWALPTILEMEYIKPLETYCGQTQTCDISMALNALSKRSKSDLEARFFLQTHKVPSVSTDNSSELVPFAQRLCSTFAMNVSEMESHFIESSPSDETISALSATLPDKSPLFSGNAILERLCDELSILDAMLIKSDTTFQDILIDSNCVPLLKSTIIACLDLIEQLKTEMVFPQARRLGLLIRILSLSWDCASRCLRTFHKSLRPVLESAFSDAPQLCSLLERTCSYSSPTTVAHFRMIINFVVYLPHLVPRVLAENLVQRVIHASKPMAVPTTSGKFHHSLVWVIANLIIDSRKHTEDNEMRKRIGKLQYERVWTPAKPYLQFILPREEFIPNAASSDKDLPHQIARLLDEVYLLERELLKDGEIVETGREEWEVGWLVEMTNENLLAQRLVKIREDHEMMRMDEKERWKKRVERHRDAGHEDAMEGWLMRWDNDTRSEIEEYFERMRKDSGMNVSL